MVRILHAHFLSCVDPSTDAENFVTAVVETLYPFSDTLTTTITATKDFTYFVRIPSWVVGGSIIVGEAPPKDLEPKNGLQAIAIKAGTTRFVLNVPAEITIG